MSLYFKQHRDLYYDRLQRIRTDGEWEEWVAFFLRGVLDVATSATETTRNIVTLVERDRATVGALGKSAATAGRVLEHAIQRVILTPKSVQEATDLTAPPVYGAIRRLEAAGILHEATGKRRNRVYVYTQYLALLNAGTEPPKPSAAARP